MPLHRTTLSILPVLALAGGLTACGDAAQEATSQNPEAAYAFGLMAARSLDQMQLSPAERAEFDRGMRDYESGTPRVTLLRELSKLQSFQMERMNSGVEHARAQAEEFLRDAAREPGAEQLPSGVVFRSLEKTEGPTPKPEQVAIVRMEGTLADGLLFLSSEMQGTVPVNMTTGIPCLTESLTRMSVGSKARVTCPPHTGYAVTDKPILVQPGAGLRFELELVEVRESMLGKGHP